jgi:5-(carboxyamino)imidazole ribonucleotide mutase
MRVAVIMGSMSDYQKVEAAITTLKKFEVQVDVRCFSAHRTPDELCSFINETKENGTEVIIAAAGMAAALPGVIASQTVLPVIGLPISGSVLDGMDALFSIVQMPPGIPVATVAINGAKNAAYLALQIIANKHDIIKEKLILDREQMRKAVLEANEKIMNENK